MSRNETRLESKIDAIGGKIDDLQKQNNRPFKIKYLMPLFGIKQVDKTLNLIDKVIPDGDKKKELKAELIQAEINSDSAYLKNARPTVVYFGLFVIFLELLGVRLFITNKISL